MFARRPRRKHIDSRTRMRSGVDNDDSDRYEVSEECVPYGPGQALVLLHLEDEMLSASFDKDLWTGRGRS